MVKVKGTTAAEKKVVAAARKAPRPPREAPVDVPADEPADTSRTTQSEDTPEAKATLPAKKAAAKEQFAKADAASAEDPRIRQAVNPF